MALVTDVLQALGILNPPAAMSNPSARLIQLWPSGRSVAQGAIVTTDGGLDRATSPTPRATAFLSAETTVRGLADSIVALLGTIPGPSGPLPDSRTVARAILAYHRADLGLPQVIAVGVPNRAPGFPAWEVGRGVRLPIELSGAGLVTDVARWTTLAASADPSWDVLFDLPPQPLTLPDPALDASFAAGVITAHPSLADAASDLREELLLNPAKAVFRMLALLAAADANAAAQRVALWTALLNTVCSTDELALLATTLPGAIVLRALYRRLAAAAAVAGHDAAIDTAVINLNSALGLPGTTAADLAVSTPSVVPAELPTSLAWQQRPVQKHPTRDATGERVDGQHQLVLGRPYFAGTFATEGRFTGPAYVGNPPYEAGRYATAHHAEVYGGADPVLTARLDVMAAISPNEGYLDAIRFRDKAILSLGVQQWTVHVDNELDVLLWNLQTDHPDDWDAHFAIYGLRLGLTSSWPAGTAGVPANSARTVTLSRAVPGTANAAMPAPAAPPEQPADRLSFFGGAPDPAHPHHYRFDPPAPWAGRLRAAARCSLPLRDLELITAANRFGRIRAEGHTWQVAGTTVAIHQLITSVQGAALLLDQHINAPGHVPADVQKAINKVHVTPVTDANGLTVAWRTAFEGEYATAVRYLPSIQKLDAIVNGKKVRGRQSFVLGLQLPATPGSFGGW
jgi:hypothetical protein